MAYRNEARLLFAAAVGSFALSATPVTQGLGNGSSMFILAEPVVCTDYCRSEWLQTIGGWHIEVAVTKDDASREWNYERVVAYEFTGERPRDPVPVDVPVATPEPDVGVMVAGAVLVMVLKRGKGRGIDSRPFLRSG